MVEIIEANPKRSFGQAILGGLLQGGTQEIENYKERKSQERQMQIAEALKGRQLEQEYGFRTQLEREKQQGKLKEKVFEKELLGQDYQTMKKYFGEGFADVWKASPQGARTALEEEAVGMLSRGEDVEDLISKTQKSSSNIQETPKDLPQLSIEKPIIPKDFEWTDFKKRPIGYTPKEWADTRKTWRGENKDIYNENKSKLSSTKKDLFSTKSLNKLNETRNVAEGFEGLLIDPETGDFYPTAQKAGLVGPEGQAWVKEIARFQNRAKDAFGSRVTNFDLQSYMKQFPGLLNSYEGRRRILKMMEINYQLDEMYSNALDQIYDHYELDGISQEKADQMARNMIKDETERLENYYLELHEQNQFIQPKLQDKKNKDDRFKLLDELT